MARSGFLFNENGSEWLGVDFYIMKMGRSGSEWLGVARNGSEWLGVARSIKW